MNRIEAVKVVGMNADQTRDALRLVLDREEIFNLVGGIGGSTASGRTLKVWADGDVLAHDRADQDQGPSTFMADFGSNGSEMFACEVLCKLAGEHPRYEWGDEKARQEVQELLNDPRVEIRESEYPSDEGGVLENLRVPVVFATWNRVAKQERTSAGFSVCSERSTEDRAYYSREEFLAAIREAGVGVDTLEHVEEMSRDWLSTQTGWSYMELPEDAFVVWREALTTPPETPEEPEESGTLQRWFATR